MAMTKKYDLAVKAGTWKGENGEEKANWKNVGIVLVDDKGGEMYMLDKTFNPAGVNTDGKDSVLLYRFPPKDKKDPETHKGFDKQGDVAKPDDTEIPF